jgi:hypothetical protein
MLKMTLSLLTFTAVLTLGVKGLANEPEHKTEHKAEHGEGHKAPLFPQPVANRAKATAPSTPELTAPAFMSKVSGGNVTLKWNSVPTADFYRVQVATDANFKWLISDEKALMHKETSFEVKGLEAGKHYYWRVFAVKSDNDPGYTKSLASKSMFEAL